MRPQNTGPCTVRYSCTQVPNPSTLILTPTAYCTVRECVSACAFAFTFAFACVREFVCPCFVGVGRRTGHSRGCASIYKRITIRPVPTRPRKCSVANALWLSRRPPLPGFSGGLALRRNSIVFLHYITNCTIWHAFFFPGGSSLAPGSAFSFLPASQGSTPLDRRAFCAPLRRHWSSPGPDQLCLSFFHR